MTFRRQPRASLALGAGAAPQRLECPSGLRVFRSARAAKAANRTARFRIRVFACSECGHHHVTNQDKES